MQANTVDKTVGQMLSGEVTPKLFFWFHAWIRVKPMTQHEVRLHNHINKPVSINSNRQNREISCVCNFSILVGEVMECINKCTQVMNTQTVLRYLIEQTPPDLR